VIVFDVSSVLIISSVNVDRELVSHLCRRCFFLSFKISPNFYPVTLKSLLKLQNILIDNIYTSKHFFFCSTGV
jgi:hypothetical protein